MFRIRKILDDMAVADKAAIAQVVAILRAQFPLITEEEIAKLPWQLHDPLKYRYRSVLFVAEDEQEKVKGFALLLYFSDIKFCYLEFISAAPGRTGGGIGSVLYERIREEAAALNVIGLFFECLPDEASLCPDTAMLKQNIARMRFYERYGVRPIINTDYEKPVTPDQNNVPYLMFDALGSERALRLNEARKIVTAILERKYAHLCKPEDIKALVASFKDDPVQLRPWRYRRLGRQPITPLMPRGRHAIALIVNTKHDIHHVRDRGYVEAPVRVPVILEELAKLNLFNRMPPRDYPERHIYAVHDKDYVHYLRRVCEQLPPGKSLYPAVFPVRNASRPPKDLPMRAGYYCIDTFTPLNKNAYLAGKGAVNCALTGAESLLGGYPLAYALVRPPGHHAERRAFGGFCYFNSAAIAAHFLSRYGRVALLDIDYHHGNGTQDIFYRRADVLTVSLHGHPRDAYPYFNGFEDERGEGEGLGFNINYPLPENITVERYRKTLATALKKIRRHRPKFLVLSLGLDTAKGDPTGSWPLQAADFEYNGAVIAALGLPTLVVQEGGYLTRTLGVNARHFFQGLWQGAQSVGKGGAVS